ncbi:MAG: hypothetical protein OXC30_04485 [Alphaproteobacteria bacterium]|nr:hypothetical protein [Alphaproteobacteria bacterium]
MNNIFYLHNLRILFLLYACVLCGSNGRGSDSIMQENLSNQTYSSMITARLRLPLGTLPAPMMPLDMFNKMIASRCFLNEASVGKRAIEILQDAMLQGKYVHRSLLKRLNDLQRPTYDIMTILHKSNEMPGFIGEAKMPKKLMPYETFDILMEEGRRLNKAFLDLCNGQALGITDCTDPAVLGDALVAAQICIDETSAQECAGSAELGRSQAKNDPPVPSSATTIFSHPMLVPMPPVPSSATTIFPHPMLVPMPPVPSSATTIFPYPMLVPMPPVPSSATTIFPYPTLVPMPPMPADVTMCVRKQSKPTEVSQHYLDLFENEFTQKSQAGFQGVRFKCLSIIKDAIAECAQNIELRDQLFALQSQIADLFQRHSQYNYERADKNRLGLRRTAKVLSVGRFEVLNCITDALPKHITDLPSDQALEDTTVWTEALRAACYWIHNERKPMSTRNSQKPFDQRPQNKKRKLSAGDASNLEDAN